MRSLFFSNQRPRSFKRIALLAVSAIALPLLLAVSIFEVYTVKSQQSTVLRARQSTLSIYSDQLERAMDSAELYISNTMVNNWYFKTIAYAKTRTEAHGAAYTMLIGAKEMSMQNPLAAGFATYSGNLDYFNMVYAPKYPTKDMELLREYAVEASAREEALGNWNPVRLSGGTVFVYSQTFEHTSMVAIVDPSQQTYPDLQEDTRIFYVSGSGEELTPANGFGGADMPAPDRDGWGHLWEYDGRQYGLTAMPVEKIGGYIINASPYVSFFGELDATQRVLIIISLCLVAAIPLCWSILRKALLNPLHRLVETTQEIQSGNIEIRVSEESNVKEVTEIAGTVNIMLDSLRRQKILSYEQKLETQQAQMQYLQLQIKPHFYLNCLNIIYSMAGERKFQAIQNLTIELSTYLRSIFRDSSQMVPLETELASLKSYVHILQADNPLPPELEVKLDEDAAGLPVPTMSILTFGENAIKHFGPTGTAPRIRVACQRLETGEGDYLNITVTDNGQGFSPEKLRGLNSQNGRLYESEHVGIANIRCRLQLLYSGRATLSFRNLKSGACVELFLPMAAERGGAMV